MEIQKTFAAKSEHEGATIAATTRRHAPREWAILDSEERVTRQTDLDACWKVARPRFEPPLETPSGRPLRRLSCWAAALGC